MKTVVQAALVHLCPFVDEVDVGTVVLEYDGPASELHDLAAYLTSFATVEISHERLTQEIAAHTGAAVTTRFRTAGLDVECSA